MFYDTDGNELQAHGAGILVVGDTYYMYGESAKVCPGSNEFLRVF
jgi:hypothetical protein